MDKDYYFILGISSDATDETIRKAYRINAVKYHPDKNSGDGNFTEKFIEIKEAYDNLIDPEKRRKFDFELHQSFTEKSAAGSNSRHSSREEEDKQEMFKYDPYVKVFSSFERRQQGSTLERPRQTPWGKALANDIEFLKFPEKIGQIVGGTSNIHKDKKIATPFSLIKDLSTAFGIILAVTFILSILHYLYLTSLNKENPLQFVLILWPIIALILICALYRLNRRFTYFFGYNFFVGINGFAFFKFKGPKADLIESIEINFNEVTDILSSFDTLEFAWINRYSKKVIYREPQPDAKVDNVKFDLNKYAEKYFTIYLLDKMEEELESKGYIEFIIAPCIPYIRLGIGFITLLKNGEAFTYMFNDIKRMYTKEMKLYIEHKNYEKVLFFKSGNQDNIPLQFLYNRSFFNKATEILLGYKIS